jgi:WD40 repeat protein
MHERFIGGGTGTVMVLAQSSSRSAYSPPASPGRQWGRTPRRGSTGSSTTPSGATGADDVALPAHSRPTVMGSLLLGILPPELQYMFYDFLDHQSLCAVSLVCREWMRAAHDDELWQAAYVRRWQSEGHNIRWSRQSTKPWRTQYAERFKVQKHWIEGKPNVMTLSAHTGTITSLRYDDTRLISASGNTHTCHTVCVSSDALLIDRRCLIVVRCIDDGSMLLWSLQAPEKRSAPLMQQHHKNTKLTHRIGSFVGHGGPVWCLDFQPDEDMLVSGSYDRTIKVWSIKSQAPRATLRGHSNWVSSIQRVGDTIVSGSWDASIKVWRVQEVATATAPLPSSTGGVVSPASSSGGGVTGFVRSLFGSSSSATTSTATSMLPTSTSQDDSDEKEERRQYGALGPVEGTCVATLSNEAGNAVCCLQYQSEQPRVACGTRRMAVQIWDVPTATLVQTYMGHVKEVGCLQFDDHKIVSGSGDHTIKVGHAHQLQHAFTVHIIHCGNGDGDDIGMGC